MQKLCTRCKQKKDLSAFSPDKRSSLGVQSSCKPCCAEKARELRAAKPELNREAKRRWRAKNKDKIHEYHLRYYAENAERIKKASIENYWLNVEKRRKRMAEVARLNRDKRREYEARRRAELPELSRAKAAKRRAAKLAAPGAGITRQDIADIIKKQRYHCAVCRVKLTSDYHVDHIVSLKAGGEHDKKNAQVLCPPCNTSKGAKHPVDFMQSRGFLC